MSNEVADNGRRRFLISATSVVGAAGIAATAWPFLDSLSPSARAKSLGGPVQADISKVALGQQVLVLWRSQPIALVNRTPVLLANLKKVVPRLADPNSDQPQQPDYCKNNYRSIKPEYLVMVLICTHLGCVPDIKTKIPDPSVAPDWLGGYLCACHGSKYDLSGRVFQGQPAPVNMVVPPYHYISDTVVEIGVDPSKAEISKQTGSD